jgi:uroporphyrinogen-III decarboxylase
MPEDKLAVYCQREARIRKALNYEPVDRIPMIYFGTAWAPYTQGIPLSRFCSDLDTVLNSTLDAMDLLGEIDGINMMQGSGLVSCRLGDLWLSKIEIPGRELPDNALWQVREQEVMKFEDYDLILNQGWEAFLASFRPKVLKMDLLEKQTAWLKEHGATLAQRYYSRGYAVLTCSSTTIPFEPLCGARSMEKFFFDCYRSADKVKAVMDVIQPFMVSNAIRATTFMGVKGTWVGGWRAASAMLSPKIWDRLVFPYYQDLIAKLHAQGILCLLHFDQNWDRDLARFLEFPKGCVLALDGATDIRRAKEVLGDHVAFLGDVPASTLVAGTPDDVYNYVRDLIRDLGPRGLLMNPGCDIPFNAPRVNVQAMVTATRECGSYA